MNWLEKRNLNLEEIKYTDILNYIGYLQKAGKSKQVINKTLYSINHYYAYKDLPSPSLGVKLIGEVEKKSALFKSEELDRIYESFNKSASNPLNTILLGLIIYQGLDRLSLYNLKLKDVDLAQGMIKVSSSGKRKEGRILKLESPQILPLHDYINNIRIGSNDKLFGNLCLTFRRLHNQLLVLGKKIKSSSSKINIEIESLTQLRQSRYLIWLNAYGIRKAQYMAGFKTATAIQKYGLKDIESLKDGIEKHHPLR